MKVTKDWITGFVDGDGCFSMVKKKNSLLHGFYVSQDEKSLDVLHALKREFGCGSIYRAGGTMYNYCCLNERQVQEKIIPHFLAHPLQTGKRYTFHQWADSLLKGSGIHTPLPPIAGGHQLTAGWFRGFVDAEGCFYASIVQGRPMPRFVIGARSEEGQLIRECQRLIGCGTLHRPGGFETLQVSSVEQLETKLIPFFETRGSAVLLRTRKRIAFQKFRKIVRLMAEKRHLSPDGMERVGKYVAALSQANRPSKPLEPFFPVVEDTVQTD